MHQIIQILRDIHKYSAHPEDVKLVVVTKNRSVDEINAVINAGATIIGENRVQEAENKFPLLKKTVGKHMIGHLQKNKVKKAVRIFDMIQSVDSIDLAQKINEECEKIQKTMPILLQINISNDPDKYGFPPKDTENALRIISELKNLKITGLMTIGKLTSDFDERRKYFQKFRQLFEKMQKLPNITLKHLSMGMSQDYQIALEEGATMIRIGSKMFEEKTMPEQAALFQHVNQVD